jgi:hypothetical protein
MRPSGTTTLWRGRSEHIRIYASTREDELAIVDRTKGRKADFLRMHFDAQHRSCHEHYDDGVSSPSGGSEPDAFVSRSRGQQDCARGHVTVTGRRKCFRVPRCARGWGR